MKKASKAAPRGAVTYMLGSKAIVQSLYPDASWLPPEYAKGYGDLALTIQKYTGQSLARDGVKGATVAVTFPQVSGEAQVQMIIRPANATTRLYAKVHPALLDATHGQAALRAVQACKQDKSSPACWDRTPRPGQPWAFYLPLGMAMVNQKTVLFLDYPPVAALTAQDYLENFTMCRWGRVMGAAGATNLGALETIVDSRPIAAPGSGEDKLLPDPIGWFGFNKETKSAIYLTPMLQLLTNPNSAAQGGSTTLPVAVFGTTPRNTWATMVNQKTDVLDVGMTNLGGQSKATPWIATNHPDVTSYNCCANDPAEKCIDKTKNPPKPSYDLLLDEQRDFVTACWLLTMSAVNPPSAAEAKKRCDATWGPNSGTGAKQALCVQAKLDNQNPNARAVSYEEAWNYCAAHNANACATFDNSYDKAKVKPPLPPKAKRPSGWDSNCAKYMGSKE